MQSDPPASGIVFLAAIVLAVVAIVRSPQKLHTALLIVGAMLIGLALAIGIGFATGNAYSAGALAGSLTSFAGIAASIERIRRYRKGVTKYNVKPL
jgi:uncharacterized transporter YbjL